MQHLQLAGGGHVGAAAEVRVHAGDGDHAHRAHVVAGQPPRVGLARGSGVTRGSTRDGRTWSSSGSPTSKVLTVTGSAALMTSLQRSCTAARSASLTALSTSM